MSGAQRYRDRDWDMWRETAPGSGLYYMVQSHVQAEEVPQTPDFAEYSFEEIRDMYGPLTALDPTAGVQSTKPRTLRQHAAAIALALADAAVDGYLAYGGPDTLRLFCDSTDRFVDVAVPRAEAG